MYEYQTILTKGCETIYLTESADIRYHVDVLGYKDAGRRTVLDGKVIDEELVGDAAAYRTDKAVSRPMWKDHEIVGYIDMSRIEADRLNGREHADIYYGFTDEERRILNCGTEEELRAAGFLGT